MNLEFWEKNFLNTTTQITVNSGTLSSYNLFSRDESKQHISFGMNSDSTIATLQIDFDTTQTVSRMSLHGINLKDFTIYHGGVTAQTFALNSSADTTSSDWSSNSNTAIYLNFTTITTTQINIDMQATQIADQEKIISYLAISNLKLNFTRLPNAGGFKPSVESQEVVHTLSDGGQRVNTKGEKFQLDMKFSAVPSDLRNNLRTIWSEKDDFIVSILGTSTGWDGLLFPVVWVGDFDFYTFVNNNPNAGYKGGVKLREVPS